MSFKPFHFVFFIGFMVLSMTVGNVCTSGGLCTQDVAKWVFWAFTAVMAGVTIFAVLYTLKLSKQKSMRATLFLASAATKSAWPPAFAAVVLMLSGLTILSWTWFAITGAYFASILIAQSYFENK